MANKERKVLVEKYQPILESAEKSRKLLGEAHAPLKTKRMKEIVATLLENQIDSIRNGENEVKVQILSEDATCLNTTNIAGWTGILINLVRRSIPQLAAHEMVGVQPLQTPSGLVFSQYATTSLNGAATQIGLPNTAYSGFASDGTPGWEMPTIADLAAQGVTVTVPNPAYDPEDPDSEEFITRLIEEGDEIPEHIQGPVATDYELDPFAAAGYTTGTAMDTFTGEGCIFPKISLRMESVQVTARTRALQACYSPEVAQDMQKMHGLDAEAELAREMANELVAEINAELMRTIVRVAKMGAQDTANPGTFDFAVDSTGHYTEERVRDLVFQIEKEANAIGFDTMAGKANWILTTANVASALGMAKILSRDPRDNTYDLDVEAPLQSYAGILNGRYKVFVDPYNNQFDYVVVGLKVSDRHAGLYYAPYVPFSVQKGQSDCNGNPQLFFRTRYGVVSNPFVRIPETGVLDGETLTANINPYFRKFAVRNLS